MDVIQLVVNGGNNCNQLVATYVGWTGFEDHEDHEGLCWRVFSTQT